MMISKLHYLKKILSIFKVLCHPPPQSVHSLFSALNHLIFNLKFYMNFWCARCVFWRNRVGFWKHKLLIYPMKFSSGIWYVALAFGAANQVRTLWYTQFIAALKAE